MVEDMEERGNGLLCRCPLLHIIDNQYIDGLIEMDEVIDSITAAGIGKLHLEQTGRNIEYALVRVHLFTTNTDGIDKVRLTTTRRSEDKEGIERRLSRMLGNADTDGTGQAVGITFYKSLERLMQIQAPKATD